MTKRLRGIVRITSFYEITSIIQKISRTTPRKLYQHQYPETKDGTFPQLTSPLRRKAQDPCFPLLLHRFIRLISSRFRSRRHQDSNRARVTSYPEISEPRSYTIPFACPRTVNLHLHVRQTFLSLSLQDIPNRIDFVSRSTVEFENLEGIEEHEDR